MAVGGGRTSSVPLEAWVPKTELGRRVQSGAITDIDALLVSGQRLLEPEIVDTLVPNLTVDLIHVGQSKGKFGGGKRSIWRQTQKTTQEGKKIRFACCAVVGNSDGLVGLGFGSAKETVPAREKAIRQAKLNLFRVVRGNGSWEQRTPDINSVPFAVTGKCGSLRFRLIPAPRGTGLCVEKECARILRLAGIHDVWSETKGHTPTKLNFVRACIDALQTMSLVRLKEGDVEQLCLHVGKAD